jgi:hypothetical protein
MTKRWLSFIAAFMGLAANTVSALNSPFLKLAPDESERLRERLMGKTHESGAVLLLPKQIQRTGRFLWLATHGSHVSHASHASHVSHASGTSSKSYTTPYVPPSIVPPSTVSPSTASPWSNASPTSPIKATVIKDVNFRTGPSTDSTKIKVFYPGQKILIIGIAGSWVKVNTVISGVTKTGWLSAECIK